MKTNILIGTIALLAGSILAADSGKDAVTGAAKKLAADNYSWRTTVDSAGGGGAGPFRPGPTEGKVDKDGTTQLSMTRGDNTIEAFLKAGKGALKGPDGWRSLTEAAEDAGGGQPNALRFMARMLQTYKTPATWAEELAGKAKDLKKEGDVYSGELTEEGAKSLLTFGRPGGNGPAVSNAKGSIKFWIKDGTVSKYEHKVLGTVSFNGNDRNVDRTTTVEIKEIGSTKVVVPEEARKKLS
jgi:hypothetical protein